jgi:hypothetical protein
MGWRRFFAAQIIVDGCKHGLETADLIFQQVELGLLPDYYIA